MCVSLTPSRLSKGRPSAMAVHLHVGWQHAAVWYNWRSCVGRMCFLRLPQDPSLCRFKLGFHAVPSMCQLHMHVVTQV